MSNKLFIGNLSWAIDSQQLEEIFSAIGEVTDAFVLTDRETGRSRGFGFVTFANEEDAQRAIDEMNEKEVDGRAIVVNVAKAKREF